MQRYFLEPESHAFLLAAPAILPGVRRLCQAYAGRGLPLVFTRHQNTPQDAGQMASWWRELLLAGSPQSEITPELDSSLGVVLTKTQYDAFYQTALEQLLRERQVAQVVICGVMAHLCCETTARGAFMRGFEVFFCADGTAADTTAHHQASLLNLAHGFATPVLVSEIQNRVQSGA